MEQTLDYKYDIEEGTAFHKSTPPEVRRIINNAIQTEKRLKFYFGDTSTGKDWCEENDTIGYVGRSTGKYKIPLLIKKTDSSGGGGILDHHILKIKDVKTGAVLYEHPKYQPPQVMITGSDLPEYEYNVSVNGKLHGRFKSHKRAVICLNKIR